MDPELLQSSSSSDMMCSMPETSSSSTSSSSSGVRGQLRTMSYEEGAAALSPNSSEPEALVCIQEEAVAEVEQRSGGTVRPAPREAEGEVRRERGGVEICTRVAEIPVAEQLGLQHWWIRTPSTEVGMGPARGNVPGVDGAEMDLPFDPTVVVDHAGQGDSAGSTCVPAAEFNPEWEGVDQSCVEGASGIGTPTGPWTPIFNDCHTWVQRTMDRCAPRVHDRLRREYEHQRYMETTHPGMY